MVESKVSTLNPFAAYPDLAHGICAETITQFAPVGRFQYKKIRSQARFKASRVSKVNRARHICSAGDETSAAVSHSAELQMRERPVRNIEVRTGVEIGSNSNSEASINEVAFQRRWDSDATILRAES